MDFSILGPLQVLDEGHEVALPGSKQRALLGVLLLHANETVSTERLIDELWGENPSDTAAKTVQVQISRLRKALAGGGGLLGAPSAYAYLFLVWAALIAGLAWALEGRRGGRAEPPP